MQTEKAQLTGMKLMTSCSRRSYSVEITAMDALVILAKIGVSSLNQTTRTYDLAVPLTGTSRTLTLGNDMCIQCMNK